MNVNCDECNKEFPISLSEKKHGQGVIETYFVCPHCSTRYSGSFTDARARKLQRQIRTIWGEIQNCGDAMLAEHKKEKIDRLTEENKRIMIELKERYASN